MFSANAPETYKSNQHDYKNENKKSLHFLNLQRTNPGRRKEDIILHATRNALFNEIPLAIFSLDQNLRYISVNQSFSEFAGFSPEKIIGKSITDLIQEKQAQKLQEIYQYVLNTGETLRNIDKCLTNKNGENAYFSMIIAPLYDKNGHITGLIGANTDISQTMKASFINANLLQENRLLTQKMFNVQEEERRNLARDLHDELGQWLIAIQNEIQEIGNTIKENSRIYLNIQAIQKCTKNMHAVVRSMLHKLRPVLLDTLGLADSLYEQKRDWYTHNPQIDYELTISGDFSKIQELTSITIYRLIQEALNNVCSHSEATKVMIQLNRKPNKNSILDDIWLKIEDNGTGFDSNKKTIGYGLLGMRERAIALNGSFMLQSAPGNGTSIHIRLPCKREETYSQ